MKTRVLLRLGAAAVALIAAQALAGPAVAATPTELLPPVIGSKSTTFTVGTAAKFTFRNPPGSTVPVQFVYQLNAGAPVGVAATDGHATVSIVPDRFTNLLSVYSVAADGSPSGTTSKFFNAAFPPPAVDQDITGDGRPDLLTVGGTPGLAPGLWQAAGRCQQGQVATPALNIGVNGISLTGSPTDYNGAQVITGKFTGASFEDFLAYYPTGIRAGSGAITTGTGNGSVLSGVSGNEYTLPTGTFADVNGDNPIQLANAYDAAGSGLVYPDLLGIVGDPTNGYTLDYYPDQGGTAGYVSAIPLTVSTPTGGSDWSNWRIYSKLLPSGTAVALWNPSTNGLYLWEGLTFNVDTSALSFTQYTLATNWQPAAMPSTLQLTDVNADGVPDLWAVTSTGDVTAYVISELSTTADARLTAQPTQHLS